ncbi:FAS1-like dehydratase domain-containing protein [Bacillus sp. JJ722]|uniref:FAS1-like dehydratase domain-containing protein n=1 Tax=Bacillus sp. JJ722 TaxID=3122973 RepID=UPI002FFF2964
MKTKQHNITFNQSEILQFVEAIEDYNPIYRSKELANMYGFETIPLPPTMPVIAYQWIDLPRKLPQPIIHRKQHNTTHRLMFMDVTYVADISLLNYRSRHNQAFVEQVLNVYTSNQILCFSSVTYLVCGGLQ